MVRATLDDLSDAIRGHSRCAKAMRSLVGDYVQWRVGLGVRNRIISNLGRERLIEHLLFLHYANTGDASDKGATFERLAALSESRDRVGARAVRTTLRLSQVAGLVVLARSRDDLRLKIFQPTVALLAYVQEFYAVLLGAFDALLPGLGLAPRIRRDRDFMLDMIARCGRAYLVAGSGRAEPASVLLDIMRLEGGQPIVATIVDAFFNKRALPTYEELSSRYQVSASQARVILRIAETEGLIRIPLRGQPLDAEALSQAFVSFLIRYMAFFARFGLDLETRFLPAPPRPESL